MKFLILCLFSLSFLSACASDSKKEAKVVFLYGARSHASGDHEFKAGTHLLAKHLNAQSAVKINAVVISGWPKDESILDDADAVIIYADGTRVIKNGWKKMDALTKKGVGVMMMHYAVHPDVKEGDKYYTPWIGGYFKNGKSANPFWIADIKPLQGHPTAQGVGPIKTIDEFYMNIEYSKRMIPLGVATISKKNLSRINNIWTQGSFEQEGKEQALLWGIQRDNGRGAGFTGGHVHANWAIDGYRQLILNTIAWVAGMDIPKGGVPTYKVTEDELNENLDDYGNKTKRVKIPAAAAERFKNFRPGPWRAPRGRKPKKK